MPNARQDARNEARNRRTRDESAEHLERLAEHQHEAGQRAARNGVELMQGYADLFRSTVETTAGLMAQFAERNAGGHGQPFPHAESSVDQMRQPPPRSVEAVGMTNEAIGGILGEWMQLVQRQTQQNIHCWNLLVRCRRPQDVFFVQTEFLRCSADNVLQSWQRITNKSVGLSEDIANELTEDAA